MEVVIAVGPAFGSALTRTIGGLDHRDVLQAIVGGLADEGVAARIVRIRTPRIAPSSATRARS